jgi:hypothetical protein
MLALAKYDWCPRTTSQLVSSDHQHLLGSETICGLRVMPMHGAGIELFSTLIVLVLPNRAEDCLITEIILLHALRHVS